MALSGPLAPGLINIVNALVADNLISGNPGGGLALIEPGNVVIRGT